MPVFQFTREAQEELREIALYIQEDKPESAIDFVDEVERVCGLLAVMPEMGRLVPSLSRFNLHVHPLGKYRNYLVFYIPQDDTVTIAHIVNGRQHLPRLFESWSIKNNQQ